MATIEIVTTPAEKRQIARTLNFDASLAPYINWDSIASQALELGANFDVRYQDGPDERDPSGFSYFARGGCIITFFWSAEDEAR